MPPQRAYTQDQIDRALDRLPDSWWGRLAERVRRGVAELRAKGAHAGIARGARTQHGPPDSSESGSRPRRVKRRRCAGPTKEA